MSKARSGYVGLLQFRLDAARLCWQAAGVRLRLRVPELLSLSSVLPRHY